MNHKAEWVLAVLCVCLFVAAMFIWTKAVNDCAKRTCPPGMESLLNQEGECLCVTRPK